MKSRISWFNTGLAANLLRRCWPLWGGYFALLLLCFPISMADRLRDVTIHVTSFDRSVMQTGLSMGYVSIAVSVLAVMLVFSWLYTAKGSGMMCSLPIRRETLFATAFLTGLVPMLLADLIAVLLSAAITVGSGYYSLDAYMKALTVLLTMNFSFYCFAVFCAVLTGNIVILPVVFVVLNCTVFVAESCIRGMLSAFVYGMQYGSAVLTALSPLVYTMSEVRVATIHGENSVINYDMMGIPMLGVYCAAGLALAVAALLILRKRNMEVATDTVALPILKPIFKYCLTVGCAIVLGPVVYENMYYNYFVGWHAAAVMALLMLVGALIGYVAAEMLIRKQVMVFKTLRWKGFAIVCCAMLCFVAAFELDVFGYERYVPKADKVQQVEIWVGNTTLSEPENIQKVLELQQQIIDNKAINETNEDCSPIYIDYIMENGKYINRFYRIPMSRIDEPEGELMRLQALCNLQEAIDRRCETQIPVREDTIMGFGVSTWYYDNDGQYHDSYLTFSPQEAVDFYENYLLPDIKAGTMGRYWFLHNTQHYETQCNVRFELNLSERAMLADPKGNYNTEYFSFNLNVDAVNCLRWLEENTDIVPMTLGKAEDRELILK